MIPYEPSARLRVLYRQHVPIDRGGPPALSLDRHLHSVRQARESGIQRRLLAAVLGVAPEYIYAIETELGVELDD
ncbi:MAG: hypothetical protein ACRDZ3_15375 [Acidimicrobiia bacterium]